MRRFRRAASSAVLRFVFPSACFVCGTELRAHQHLGACVSCWAGLRPLGTQACPTCGLPRPPTTDLLGPARGRCARCVLEPPPLGSVRASVAYDTTARRFLHRAKLGWRRELFPSLAAQMSQTARRWPGLLGVRLVAPVPSHPWTNLRRGFEPANELAVPIARALGVPVRRLLAHRVRVRAGVKRLRAARRRETARSAFRVRDIVPRSGVLLVDDVMTTGSTLEACALALRRAGAKEVRALIWARALRRWEG